MNKKLVDVTTAPLVAGDFTATQAEFCRMKVLASHFGIPRGTAYNLMADGKIKSVLLRSRGQKSGLRLIDLASVRDYIRSEATHQ